MKPRRFADLDTLLLLSLAAITIVVHAVVNLRGYGMFRDEFYYLACADHLAWGYVDHPPLSILMLAVWKSLFGSSVFAIRLLPALLSGVIVFLTGKIAAELGGKRTAQFLAALAVVVAPGYLGIHGMYSMNVIDHLAWTTLIYIVIKIINTGNAKLWWLFGLAAGLGLMNKISVLFFAFGLGIGILLTTHRRWLLDKRFWLGAALAGLIFLPHILWQLANGWPTLEFMANAAQYKNLKLSPMQFFTEQIINMNPAVGLMWLAGLFYLLFSKRLQKYRLFAIMYIAILGLFIFQNAKAYYLFPVYPVLFAAGAVLFEEFFPRHYLKWLASVAAVLFLAIAVFAAPMALPILPVEKFIAYAQKSGITPQAGENHQMGVLPQHFADMHGWPEMAAAVAAVYHALPDSEKTTTAIYAQNYGQAGAIDYFGEKYGLPPALCGHNNYFLWGLRGQNAEVLIIFGGRRDSHAALFDSVEEAGFFTHPFVMPYENNATIYICRGLKVPLKEAWAKTKHFD